MIKSLTFNARGIKTIMLDLIQQIIKNRRKLLLTVMFIFGLWCGTYIYMYNSNISTFLQEAFKNIANVGIIKGFFIILIANTLSIILTFLSGFFTFGLPLIIINPCAAGIITGITNAWMFNAYKLNGVFFSLISIIPFAVITIIMLFISCNEAATLSSKIIKAAFFNEATDRGEVRDYFIRHLIITAVLIITSMLQALIITNVTDKLLFI